MYQFLVNSCSQSLEVCVRILLRIVYKHWIIFLYCKIPWWGGAAFTVPIRWGVPTAAWYGGGVGRFEGFQPIGLLVAEPTEYGGGPTGLGLSLNPICGGEFCWLGLCPITTRRFDNIW